MKAVTIKLFLASIFCIAHIICCAQEIQMKKEMNESEIEMIQITFNQISKSDQLYRGPLAKGTLDKDILAKIDSVYEIGGIREGMTFEKSLKLSMPKELADSLWRLQHVLDFQNHLKLRGIFETYGFIPKDVVEEKNYVQILMMMHPPKDWDVRNYQQKYTELLKPEVFAGRMPAKTFAMFYDNMLAKILREPQLYGTNQKFNTTTKEIMPPGISDLAKSNDARKEIGLPILKEGEYRILK